MFLSTLVNKNSKLVYVDTKEKLLYDLFIKNLKEGDEVEIFICKKGSKATGAQISKIHACIREIALELGYGFEDVKLLVKEKAGLCFVVEDEGNKKVVCKSFADCSSMEMSLAIEACKDIGEQNNINLG